MENKRNQVSKLPEEFPSLIRYIVSKSVADFDTVLTPRTYSSSPHGSESEHNCSKDSKISPERLIRSTQHHRTGSVSISLPSSPSGFQAKRVIFSDYVTGTDASNVKQKTQFHSQPINAVISNDKSASPNPQQGNERLKDKRFDSFKTFSGKLERQISSLRGKRHKNSQNLEISEVDSIPAVDRYFVALEGPELETLKASENLVLPEDQEWPFLLRFPISSFGICLGVGSQAMLWKTLSTSSSTRFLHISLTANLILWFIALILITTVATIYLLKFIFYFEAVRREYYHPIRVNFFFAPWIACLFLVIGLPPLIAVNLHEALWYALMGPIFLLELKIYGQWMSGGQRRLSRVANPSNHLSIVGNFVGALLGASMGLIEGPIFFFAVGLAHYIVLFVTLYQRLPTNKTLPKDLHPVFFLFVAAPSVACMAWAKINGEFNIGARIAYFIALFLYFSLAVRINFFRGFRFSLAWWAYTFPTTGAAIATVRYAAEVENTFTRWLAVALSSVSTVTLGALFVSTAVHAFVLGDLFPNDSAIAIEERRSSRAVRKNRKRAVVSSDSVDIESQLRTSSSDAMEECPR